MSKRLRIALSLLLLATQQWIASSSAVRAAPPLPSGRYVAVSLNGDNVVTIRRLPDLAAVDKINAGWHPGLIASLGDKGRVFVFPDPSTRRNEFVDYNLFTHKLAPRIKTATPYTGQLNGDGSKLYVTSLGSGTAVVVNTATDKIVQSLATTPRPDNMDIDAAHNELYVADNQNGQLSVYDMGSDTLGRRFRAEAIQQIALAGGKVYWETGGNVIFVSDRLDFTSLATVQTPGFPLRLRASDDRNRVWVLSVDFEAGISYLSELDTASDSITTTYSVTGLAYDFVVDEAGARAMLPLPDRNALTVLDLLTTTYTVKPIGKRPVYVELIRIP